MKKYAATLAAALMVLLGLTALAPSAQAYPSPLFDFQVSLHTVVSGRTFDAVAHASVTCNPLTMSWNGQTASTVGNSFSHVFRAPIVSKPTRITAKATCTFTQTVGASGAALRVGPQTATRYATITVLPLGSGGGHLPNTGGPSIGWLIAGIAALLAGAGTMFAGRRRHAGVASH